MKFLVTNADGLDCIFLHEFVHALRDAGHSLAVVAPIRLTVGRPRPTCAA